MNMKAIETAGRLQLPYTGGSDAHMPREVGSCYTEFGERVTYDNFIDCLRGAGSGGSTPGRYRELCCHKFPCQLPSVTKSQTSFPAPGIVFPMRCAGADTIFEEDLS